MPLLILYFNFHPFEAIPISKFIIFISSLSSFLLNLTHDHPKKKDSFVINYSIPLLLIPMIIAGSIIGVLLNRHIPVMLVVVFLTSFLFVMTIQTILMGVKKYKFEKGNKASVLYYKTA